MLEKLNTIDWANLEDALGSAVDLPDYIRALASDDEELANEALSQIWDRIWQYGRITEATPYAIPFLLEMANAGALGEQLRSVLELLGYLGDGPTPWIHEIINLKTYGEYEEGESLVLLDREVGLSADEIDAIFERAKVYIKQSHDAVREGLPFYLDLLETSNSPEIRVACAWLIVGFPECTDISAPCLRTLIDQELDITVKATLVWCLGRLVSNRRDPQDLMLFSRLAFAPMHPLIYFYAAAAYANIEKENTPPTIAALVATGIYREWNLASNPPLPTPGAIQSETEIAIHGYRAISRMGAGHAVPILLAVLAKLDSIEHKSQRLRLGQLTGALLDLAFSSDLEASLRVLRTFIRRSARFYMQEPVPKIVVAEKLTGLQRQVLEALVAADSLWAYEDNIYVLYGLPANRDDLRELVVQKHNI